MKRSVFSTNRTRTANTNNSLVRCFGTEPSVFRTTAALHGWGPGMDFFSANSSDKR